MKERKVLEEPYDEPWTPSKKLHVTNASQDYIRHIIAISKKLDADLNFPKIYLMPHWAKLVHRYRALRQYSTNRHEQAHKTNLKDGWNASNHNRYYLPQVITFQRRILCFQIRELNLEALAQRRENSAAACNVLPSGADLAAPLSHQSYAKPEFMGPQNP